MVIGIVGGMGSYATVDLFKRLVDAFPAEKEWDRPRILLDNYCTMPSRVRAILYNERREELCKDLAFSVKHLIESGADKIILACNTSHVFLPEIKQLVPEAERTIVDIIDTLANDIHLNNVDEVNLIASEGTIETKIYNSKFARYGITINSPTEIQYKLLRDFIEAIKQNNLTESIMSSFVKFVDECSTDSVILGCTELPILYSECLKSGFKFRKKIFDPLQSTIDLLVSNF